MSEGKVCHFMMKKGKEKYEELPLSSILYSNYLTNNLNVTKYSLTKQ